MTLRQKIILGVVGLVALVIGAGLGMPRTFSVERSTVVSAPLGEVYALAADLTKHPLWSARKLRDPSMRFSFPGKVHAGMGAVYEWTSEESDAGTCTIVAASPDLSLTVSVHVKGKGDGTAIWRFEPEGSRTRVTRQFEGEIPIPVIGPWIVLLVHPQDKLGADFEQELEAFRKIAEGAAPSA